MGTSWQMSLAKIESLSWKTLDKDDVCALRLRFDDCSGVDPGRSPIGIGLSHDTDEFLNLRAEVGPARLIRAGLPYPAELNLFRRLERR